MPLVGAWCKVWIYFGFVSAWSKGARPRFDTSTDMGLVLVPADAEVDSVIFRLRATDQDADFPLVFEITATITPVVRIDNLPCTLYNKVCQANVILTKRLIPGRLHDFAVRVKDSKGDSNSMQATISVTNATTPRDKIFPHIPSLIMVPEDTKPGKELDYLLVRANSWSGKPVYIELWQPKELFTIRQRQTPTQTRGIITLIGEIDFETQSMYTLTMYATDPYTEPGKDTRNIAGLNVVVVVQDVQDVPPIFTLAPPLTRINNSVQPGDIILRVHAEDGDKGVPREIAYGLVSEGNPFTPFFNISETTGEIVLARPLEELTQITHVGAPVVLTVVAEEIRRSREEPPAQATVVEVGFLLGEPGNSPPYFESDNYVVTIDENPEPGTVITFGEQYATRVRDEDIGKAGVFALKLENNNGTFEINPTVAERTADFIITVRDNTLIDYEMYKSLTFKIIAQEVGPATNLSAMAPVTIFLRDVNDNAPVFDEESYEVTLSENITAGTRVIQVHATDKDTGVLGSIRYTDITGDGSDAFTMDPDTGLITVSMGSSLDREIAPKLLLSVEARDENGKGNRGVAPLTINLLDVNDNAPLFEKNVYEFTLNSDLTNFTTPAIIKAIDADAEPPNNEVRYELVHGNYENKFHLNEITGELTLRSPITKVRRKKQSAYESFPKKNGKEFARNRDGTREIATKPTTTPGADKINEEIANTTVPVTNVKGMTDNRLKRANDDALYTLTARAYDLGVPHMSSATQIRVLSGAVMEARIMMFVVPGEHPDSTRTAEALAAITGGRVTVLEMRPYVQQNITGGGSTVAGGGKKSIVVARVEQTKPGTPLVDVEKIRNTLAANGVGIIGGTEMVTDAVTKPPVTGETRNNNGQTTNINNTIISKTEETVTAYRAENKLLFWLLIILGLLMLLAIAALIICCICPGCPFYMAPRKRRVHSSETMVIRTDGRPKRHLHRKPAAAVDVTWNGRKQAWSADPTRRNWQFNRRNTKNCGLASLPGDVAYISGQQNDVQVNIEPPRLRDGPVYDLSRRSRAEEQERMYMEDVEAQKLRGYDTTDLDSLQRHEVERGSDIRHPRYRQRSDTRYIDPDTNEDTAVREQHFYREGNAEVLRLVTRGQVDDTTVSQHHHHHHHHPTTTLVVDGKDIILRRFMDDQKSRHELSMQDLEAARSMESHQRSKEVCQQQPEIIIIPDRLDLGHRQHVDELGPNVQRLVIDHGDYDRQKIEVKDHQAREISHRQERQDSMAVGAASMSDRPTGATKEHVQSTNVPSYSFHDLELARQNALLTRLLLERENRHVTGGVIDSTSYLETQSLPGQVAIATQTDKTAATQTDRQVRSRSDNDESDEDSRHRKKLKSKKRYGDGEWKRTRTLWMKSPIEEEGSPCFDKRLSILRKKVREVKEGRKASLEPDVLREISDSLDGNGSSYRGEEEESTQMYKKSTEQTSIRYKILNEGQDGSQSSTENGKDKCEKVYSEKIYESKIDAHKAETTESTSSPELRSKHEKHMRGKADERSPKKDSKTKAQRKADSMVKPSFRILEREITMLTKKLSKLGDKKQQESTGSDSTSQEKSGPMSKDSMKDFDQKSAKKADIASSRVQKPPSGFTPGTSKTSLTEQSATQRKEAAIAKTRQKLKYQQAQVMSAGSSEYEDSFEKSRKQASGFVQEASRQKQPVGSQMHAKLKRQAQVERRESKKQTSQSSDQEVVRQKDSTKENLQTDTKVEKAVKSVMRAPKLAAISHRENVSEEPGTSTSSDRLEDKKTSTATRDWDKKSNTDTSGNDTDGFPRRKSSQTMGQISQRFSDHFVEDSMESTQGPSGVPSETKDTKNKSIGHEEVPDRSSTVTLTKPESADENKSGEESTKVHQLTTQKIGEGAILLRDIVKEQMEEHKIPAVIKKEEDDLIDSAVDSARKDEKITAIIQPEVQYIDKRRESEKDDQFPDEPNTASAETVADQQEVRTPETSKAEAEKIVESKLSKHVKNDTLLGDVKSEAEEIPESAIEKDKSEKELLPDTEEDLHEEVKEMQHGNEEEQTSVGVNEKTEQHKSEDKTEKDTEMKRSLSDSNSDGKEEQKTELTQDVQKTIIALAKDQGATFSWDEIEDDIMQQTQIEEKHTASDLPSDHESPVEKMMAETTKKEVQDDTSSIDKSEDYPGKHEESTDETERITIMQKEDAFEHNEDTAKDEQIGSKCEEDTSVPEKDIVKQEENITEHGKDTSKIEEHDARDKPVSTTNDEDAVEHEKDVTKHEETTSKLDTDPTTSNEGDTMHEQLIVEHTAYTPNIEKHVTEHEQPVTEHEVDDTKLEKNIVENKNDEECTIIHKQTSVKLEEDTPGHENIQVEKDVIEHADNSKTKDDLPKHEDSVMKPENDTIQHEEDTSTSVDASVTKTERSPVTPEAIIDEQMSKADDVSRDPVKEPLLPDDKEDSHHDTTSQVISVVPLLDGADKKGELSSEITPPEIKIESPHQTEEELQETGEETIKEDKKTEIFTDEKAVASTKDEVKEAAIHDADGKTASPKRTEIKDNAISTETLDDKVTVHLDSSAVEEEKSSEDSSDKQVTVSEKPLDPVQQDDQFTDKTEISPKSVPEKSTEPEETPEDKKTESPKLEAEIAGSKASPELKTTKTDDDLLIAEPLPVRTTSQVADQESPESEAATSTVRAEHKEQLKLESEKSKLQEVRKFIEEQTFEAPEDKGQHFEAEQLSGAENLRKSFVDEPRKQDVLPEQTDKTSRLEEKVIGEKSNEDDSQRELYSDVSLPLFTSIIDTLDDSDESDSSSDISRKTTLTTRPYHTPRHRARTSPEKDSNGVTENADLKSLESDDQGDLAVELPEDKLVELSKDDKEFVAAEDVGNEPSTSGVTQKTEENGNIELKEPTKSRTSKENPLSFQRVVTGGNLRRTYKGKSLDSKSSSEPDERSRRNTRHSNNVKVEPHSKDRGRRNIKDASAFVPETQSGKGDSSKTTEEKVKQPEKLRTSQRKKKQSPPEKTSEEKPVRSHDKPHFRQRSQKPAASDSTKKKKDPSKSKEDDPPKQPRGSVDESQRKQSLSKSRVDKERKSSSGGEKSSSPPKTGEMDTSKAQPKYMAWYQKKRDEMEKKRTEMKTADDDEQLPRWLRKSMRKKSDKAENKKQDHKTPEVTPQTRRKVKPLVNVESEQLKAIVRQGRKLRKAEGGTNEDPPVQIFATTPPAEPPPPPDAKHRLVQHSEYKYEKIPPPFYLHPPPPPPHPSPQLSPERFESQPTMECRHPEESLDSGIAMPVQGASRLRHQQLLEKKSVFDIAYNEAAPSQLRADSTTPPS